MLFNYSSKVAAAVKLEQKQSTKRSHSGAEVALRDSSLILTGFTPLWWSLQVDETLTPQAGSRAEAVGLCRWRPDHQILDDLHRSEQREQPLGEGLVVGVNVRAFVHVIEGQLPVVVVKVDAHLAGDEARWQGGEGHRQGLQLGAPLQPQGQVPRVCVEGLEALPQGRLFGHTQTPVALAHLRLPVVAAGAQALHPDGAPPAVEALVEVGDVFPFEAAAHLLLIGGDEQIGVSCVQVQSHVHLKQKTGLSLQTRHYHQNLMKRVV